MLSLPGTAQLLSRPPLWREGRSALELAALLRDPVFRRSDPAVGAGKPVLLVPGFLAGDGSLGVMTGWLRRQGYRTRRAGMRFNVACSSRTVDALEARAETLAERHGTRVAVIGQSRGGTLGRALAVRRPDLVETLVALGSPQLEPLAIHPLVLLQVGVVGALGTLGAPGMFSQTCWRGECCREFRDSFARPFPADVRYLSIYSRTDGVVDWRSCLDPAAVQVEVAASHVGMAVSAPVYRAVAAALAGSELEPVAAEQPLAA
jgi:pimeloyl-ACP methyl ester carboxylesterase